MAPTHCVVLEVCIFPFRNYNANGGTDMQFTLQSVRLPEDKHYLNIVGHTSRYT